MLKQLSKKITKLYKDFVYANRFIKLARIFHYEKFFCEELSLKKETKCLLLAPHPDDETFGCGGLLINNFENFDIVCLTDGKKGGYGEVSPQELASIRKNEFSSVMNKLNILSYKFLDIPDGKLIYNYDTFKQINYEDYDYIFIPNYFDQHKDHKAVTTLLQKYALNHKLKSNVKIAYYEVWATLPFPNYFVDITSVMDVKKDLIGQYSSQTKYVNFLKGISALNSYRGILVNRDFSELFSIIDLNTFMKL